MVTFTKFESFRPVSRATNTMLRETPDFPAELADLWHSRGVGFIGDGFVRLVDPHSFAPFLSEWFTDADDAVVFAATGMGDLFCWQPGVIRQVMYRTGQARELPVRIEALMAAFEEPDHIQGWLHASHYFDAVARLGRPEINEAFVHSPYLTMGGADEVFTLERGDLAVALRVYVELVGKLSVKTGLPAKQGSVAGF